MADEPTCGSIMATRPTVIAPTDTVATALALLLERRQLALPVAESDGLYRGMFLRSLLLARLLPRIAQMEDKLANVSRIVEAAAAGETVADLRERYQEIARHPVERHIDISCPVLRPDTPLIHTVHLLYRARTLLPVVETRSGKLVGVVSAWDLLSRLSAES
jgi:CBS domain-containing protein